MSMITIRLCTVRIIAFLLSLLADHALSAHGFASTTLIRSSKKHSWFIIEQTAYRSKERKKQCVTSYDPDTASWTTKRVTGGAYATTNCYCRLSFDEDPHNDIICSPTQLFYRFADAVWVPAYELKVNDLLLAEQGTHICLHNLVLVKEHLKLHTIQVEDTHTFLVGVYGIVAHNMLVPVSAVVGLTVPFGVEWGGAAGSFFGPPGIIGGIVIGGLLGCVIKSCTTNKVREYQLVFDPAKIQRHLLNNNSKSDQSSAPKHLRQSVLAQPMLDPEDPDKDKNNERKTNTMPKQEAFKQSKIANDYEKVKGRDRWKRKKGAQGLDKKAQFLEWDNLHKDIEAYDSTGNHLGSYEPTSLKLYKDAIYSRTIDV